MIEERMFSWNRCSERFEGGTDGRHGFWLRRGGEERFGSGAWRIGLWNGRFGRWNDGAAGDDGDG